MLSNFEIVCGTACAAILLGWPVAWCLWSLFKKEARRVGACMLVLFICATIIGIKASDSNKPPTPPPVIVVKDIEIKSYKCDHTGCEITWACGTNITVGVDKFIVQRSTRQIPARTGWNVYEDYGESMTTNWATMSPQHASDVRWKIIVRKEAQ